jgi:protease I
MAQQLSGEKIAILATDGFEQSELIQPQRALKDAGATIHVISPKSGSIRGWDETDWGDEVPVDLELSQARPEDYDGLVLRDGQINPDKLRLESAAVQFVRAFFEAGKPVGAICHGPWLLVEADVARERTLTSYASIKTDLKNAARTGSIARWWSIRDWSPAATRATSTRSAPSSSRSSPRAVTKNVPTGRVGGGKLVRPETFSTFEHTRGEDVARVGI